MIIKYEQIKERKSGNLKEKLREGRFLGNLFSKYLLFATPDSLLIIDQHAAHERITFEKLKGQIEKGAIEIQQLLAPILVKLSPQEIILWEENQSIFQKTGFSCTLFDQETLAIHAHPQLITQPQISVRNLLSGQRLNRMEPEQLARLACRSSVMAGESLNKEKAEYQRQELLLCQDPFTCPHGRPTVIEIHEEALNKQFLRSS
jgi:DNA mismatch repair protein MutL